MNTPPEPTPSSVLCGTDFTPAAGRAANLAAALANGWRTPLDLVHASVIPAYPPMVDELDAEAARLRLDGTEVRQTMLDGNADEALVHFADTHNCRLIVVSALGKRAPERWLLGSVSERTAERASVPTLVVRNAAPLLAWARREQPLRVFVAFNLTPTAEAALLWTKALQTIAPCQIEVGFVDFPPEERNRLGGTGPIPLVGNPPAVQSLLENEVKSRATAILGTDKFATHIQANWGRPDAALAEMAESAGADLIVVGCHQYQGFERLWHASVSRGLLHRAKANVVVVPMAAG